jgi:hypothetical protein
MGYFNTLKLSISSKKSYDNSLDRWISAFNKKVDIDYIINNSAESLNILKKCKDIKNTFTNHHLFISAIVAYIEHELLDKGGYVDRLAGWKLIQKENNSPQNKRYLTGAPTELQKNKQYPWSKILEIRDSLDIGSTKILLAMYTYINPVRADYYSCKLCDDEASVPLTDNYIMMKGDSWKVVLQDYKTHKKYGKIELIVPEELKLLLVEYIKLSPKNYLFENENNKPFTRKTFSTWASRRLKEVFNGSETLTGIRHSYTSTLDYNGGLSGLSSIAERMGHSVWTQRQYRWDVPSDTDATNEIILPT